MPFRALHALHHRIAPMMAQHDLSEPGGNNRVHDGSRLYCYKYVGTASVRLIPGAYLLFACAVFVFLSNSSKCGCWIGHVCLLHQSWNVMFITYCYHRRRTSLTRIRSNEREKTISEQRSLDEKLKSTRDQLHQGLLKSYREDLAFWLSDLCGEEVDDSEHKFFEHIEDGVLLCKVAQIIIDAENAHIKVLDR